MIILIELLHLCLLSLRSFIVFPEFYIFPYLASNNLIPYKQIIDQHVPSLVLSPLNFYALGFKDISSFKVLFIIIILFQSLCVVYLAKKIWSQKIYAQLSALIFSVLQPFISGTALWYDTLTPLATLPAAIFLVSKRFILAGLFLGLAIVLKQTLIVLNAFLVLYIWRKFGFKKAFRVMLGMAIFPLGLMYYLYQASAIKDFITWAIVFNLTLYPKMATLHPSKEVVYMGSAFVGIALFFWLKVAKSFPQKLLVLIGVGVSLGGLSRLDAYHLHGSVPFIAILLAAIVIQHRKFAIFVVLFLLSLIILDYRHSQFSYEDATSSQLTIAINQYAKPHTKIFLLGVQPHIYVQSQTLPAGDLFFFHLPWYLDQLQDRQVDALKASPPALIVYDPNSSVDGIPIQKSASKLIDYMTSNYHQVDHVAMYTLYIPNQ